MSLVVVVAVMPVVVAGRRRVSPVVVVVVVVLVVVVLTGRRRGDCVVVGVLDRSDTCLTITSIRTVNRWYSTCHVLHAQAQLGYYCGWGGGPDFNKSKQCERCSKIAEGPTEMPMVTKKPRASKEWGAQGLFPLYGVQGLL